jgi:hypothetical protein
MKVKVLLTTALAALVLGTVALRSEASDRALATALSNDATEASAVAAIAVSGRAKVRLLLSWATKPPGYVPQCGLFDGLSDAFGELKVKEAIPYLVKNIGVYRSCGVSLAPWLKAPSVIQWNLPAVGALVKIGSDASRAAMAAFPAMANEEDRRAAIFVVSQIGNVPEARAFLVSVMERADREHSWEEEALTRLDPGRAPRGNN